MELKICHLYPDLLFGERGNLICLRQRLLWRGIGCTVTEAPVGTPVDFSAYDLFFLGGGEDFELSALQDDLSGGKAAGIRSAVEDGRVFLAVGGGMQLMGKYREQRGEKTELVGAADFRTELTAERLTGNCLFECESESGLLTVVGFENHAGHIYLGENAKPLGRVVSGYGSNGKDGTEGCRYKNLFCTSCGGPILAKSPALADLLLLTALRRRYPDAELSPLDDSYELQAQAVMEKRLRAAH